MLPDQTPVNGPGHANRLDICEAMVGLLVRAGELLVGDTLQARHQVEAEKMAKGEPHDTLPVGINKLAVDIQVRAVVQHAFDHGSDL